MPRSPRVALVASFLLAGACTPKRGDVIDWNRVRLEALRDRVRKLAESLPPPGQALRFAGHPPVEPLAHWSPSLENATNTDLLMLEDIAHPSNQKGLLPSWHLQRALWLLETADAPEAGERDPSFREEVKHVLTLRYAILVRRSSDTLEAFLGDLATGGIRAAVVSDVKPGDGTLQELAKRLREATGGTFDGSG